MRGQLLPAILLHRITLAASTMADSSLTSKATWRSRCSQPSSTRLASMKCLLRMRSLCTICKLSYPKNQKTATCCHHLSHQTRKTDYTKSLTSHHHLSKCLTNTSIQDSWLKASPWGTASKMTSSFNHLWSSPKFLSKTGALKLRQPISPQSCQSPRNCQQKAWVSLSTWGPLISQSARLTLLQRQWQRQQWMSPALYTTKTSPLSIALPGPSKKFRACIREILSLNDRWIVKLLTRKINWSIYPALCEPKITKVTASFCFIRPLNLSMQTTTRIRKTSSTTQVTK